MGLVTAAVVRDWPRIASIANSTPTGFMEWELADRAEDLSAQIGPCLERAADACYRAAWFLQAHAAEIVLVKQTPLTPEQRMARLEEALPRLFQ